MMKGSIERLDGFILDILEYSRNSRTELKNEEIHFEDLLKDITGNLKFIDNTDNRKVNISYSVSNGIPFHSDKSRLSILLNNLISNSIRYQNPETDQPFVDVQVDVSPDKASLKI